MALSYDGAVADAGDDEPTVILVGKNGIALQWLDPDPEDVRSGEETVREVPRQRPNTFRNFGLGLPGFGRKSTEKWVPRLREPSLRH